MNTAGSLERKRRGMLVEMDVSRKKALPDAQERINAARAPNWSANLVRNGTMLSELGPCRSLQAWCTPDGWSCTAISPSFIHHGKHWSDSQMCSVPKRGLDIQRSAAHWAWALDNLSSLLTTSHTKLCLAKKPQNKSSSSPPLPKLEVLPGGGVQGPVLKHQLPTWECRHCHFGVTGQCISNCHSPFPDPSWGQDMCLLKSPPLAFQWINVVFLRAAEDQPQAEAATAAQLSNSFKYYHFGAHSTLKFYFLTLKVGSDEGIRLANF